MQPRVDKAVLLLDTRSDLQTEHDNLLGCGSSSTWLLAWGAGSHAQPEAA
jgi:hypothetical protein